MHCCRIHSRELLATEHTMVESIVSSGIGKDLLILRKKPKIQIKSGTQPIHHKKLHGKQT